MIDRVKVETYGEVLTPPNIVSDILDIIPMDILKNGSIYEPGFGTGNFIIGIMDKLHIREEEDFIDVLKRIKGVELQHDNVVITHKRLLEYAINHYGIVDVDGIRQILTTNLVQGDYLSIDVEPCNLVLSNPPYQDSTNKNGAGGGKSLYHFFLDKAIEQSNKYVAFIIPSSWMQGYPKGIKHTWVDNLRSNTNLVEIHDYKDAHDVFLSVTINSGVDYFLIDKEKTTKDCKFYIHSENNKECIDITLTGRELFRDKYAYEMYNCIEQDIQEHNFSELVGGKEYFTKPAKIMHTNWKEYTLKRQDSESIYYLANFNRHKVDIDIAYVQPNQVVKNVGSINRPKLYESSAVFYTQKRVIDKPRLIVEPSVCSESFIPIFSETDSVEELKNISKYMQTKFFRYLVYMMKKDQSLPNTVYKLVPLQNFNDTSDIQWFRDIKDIDNQLYIKYNISKDLQEHINNLIEEI